MTDAPAQRSNEAWLSELRSAGRERDRAVLDLRDYLLRAILVYLSRHRSDLANRDYEELRQLAEDWAQLALLKVLDQLDGFRGDSKFTTWVYRVAINLVAGELRRKRWSNLSLDALMDDRPSDRRLRGDRSAVSPEQRITRGEVWQVVETAIENELTERQREVITRVVLEGAAPERVAEEMGTNRNNVYKILHDARRRLKRVLLAKDWSAEEMLAAFAGPSEA